MKKLISVCMALMLVLMCIPLQASADGTPTFAVGTAEAHRGETVDIPVLIENNPGIIAFRVTVSFDTDVLTLKNVVSDNLFSEGTLTFGGSYDTSAFKILWENGTGSNSTDNGAFATLTFLVAEDAPLDDTVISISYSASSTFNYDMNEVAFGTRSGAVTVVLAEVGGWSFTEDSTLALYEGYSGEKYVTGMDFNYPAISDYIETTGGWTFEVEPNEEGTESTGAKLIIYDADGNVAEEYFAVLFGDVDGNGVCDMMDVSALLLAMDSALDDPWANYMAYPDEFPQSFAADADHNLVLDGMDMSCLLDQMYDRENILQIVEE